MQWYKKIKGTIFYFELRRQHGGTLKHEGKNSNTANAFTKHVDKTYVYPTKTFIKIGVLLNQRV